MSYNIFMINFDSLTLSGFLTENIDFLAGASVRKIQQPTRRELILNLWKNGISKKFYININPSFFHICFIENLQSRDIVIPDSAPMFCMLLRKYIQNSRISEVVQPFGERILEFVFEYKDILNQTSKLCLAIELMGKYSNIVLYNKESNTIIGCAHNVGDDKSSVRELAGMLPYIYPNSQNKLDLLSCDFQSFSSNIDDGMDETALAVELSSNYYYITMPMVRQLLRTLKISEFSSENLDNLFLNLKQIISLKNIRPSVSQDMSEFALFDLENSNHYETVNDMIDGYFSYHLLQKVLKQKKSKIYSHIEGKLKKLYKLLENFKNTLSMIDKADLYKIKGDVLMMNINSPVCKNFIAVNPYDNKDISIELDEQLTIIQNANRYYKLYKKTKTAVEYANTQIENVSDDIEFLSEQKLYVDIATNSQELEEISNELGLVNQSPNKKIKKHQINIEVQNLFGYSVYIGKNSLQNDFLLSKIASPEDLWFHPLNAHGAHVILKKNNSKETIPNDVLLECAKLAKRFSDNKNLSKIPIIFTERKYVKKANSKIAFVTYKNEKEIYC